MDQVPPGNAPALPTVDALLAFIDARRIEAFDFGVGVSADGGATLSVTFGGVELVITGAFEDVRPLAEAARSRM